MLLILLLLMLLLLLLCGLLLNLLHVLLLLLLRVLLLLLIRVLLLLLLHVLLILLLHVLLLLLLCVLLILPILVLLLFLLRVLLHMLLPQVVHLTKAPLSTCEDKTEAAVNSICTGRVLAPSHGSPLCQRRRGGSARGRWSLGRGSSAGETSHQEQEYERGEEEEQVAGVGTKHRK